MAATRKRKSTRTATNSKKTKAEEDESLADESPADDQTAAAEALEALSKVAEEKDAVDETEAGDDADAAPAKVSNGGAATESSDDAGDVKADDDAPTEDKAPPSEGGEATAETAAPPKETSPVKAAAAPPVQAKAAPSPAAAPVAAPVVAAPVVAPAAVPRAQPAGVPSGVPVAAAPIRAAPVAAAPVAAAPVAVAPPALAVAPAATDLVVEETGSVPALYVGRVIGRGGETVRDLQARSGCRIDVDQNVPRDAPRIVTYRGTRAAIDLAKRLVALLCVAGGEEADLPLGRAARSLVRVPETAVGKIIGRAGEMIRKMQSESQASIQVDHTGGGAEAGRRLVTITGTPESVAKAEEMVLFLAANPAVDALQALNMLTRDKTQGGGVWGSGPPYPNLPSGGQGMPDQGVADAGFPGAGYGAGPPGPSAGYGGGTYGPGGGAEPAAGGPGGGSDIFPCSKTHVGRVIGQKGATINDLQKRSGCDIQINQNVPQGQDCQITLRGSREGIEMAKRMLQDILELGSNHPYAGGHGQYGTGQQGADPYQQQPAYGGYAAPGQQQQPQMYAPQPYGAQAQPSPYGQPYQQAPPAQAYPPHGSPYGAPPGAPQAAPSPWKAATAADGQVYYYNQITQETQWDRPAGMQ